MLKYLKYILAGILFGIVMGKAEIISWYRIYEMFSFDAFHMYGVIGSAVILGLIGVYFMKKSSMSDIDGSAIHFKDKKMSYIRYIVGGILFGLGWALVGACPGPMFVLLGFGYLSILIVIFGALIGTFLYGLARPHLPH